MLTSPESKTIAKAATCFGLAGWMIYAAHVNNSPTEAHPYSIDITCPGDSSLGTYVFNDPNRKLILDNLLLTPHNANLVAMCVNQTVDRDGSVKELNVVEGITVVRVSEDKYKDPQLPQNTRINFDVITKEGVEPKVVYESGDPHNEQSAVFTVENGYIANQEG